MYMLKMLTTTAAAAAVALAGSSAAAQAPIEVEAAPPQARVSYADLNLSTPTGVSALRGRIRAAAGRLCLEHRGGDLWERMTRQACFNAAVASARPQIERAIAHYGRTELAGGGTITLAVR